jgi:hypothetical protein
MMSLMDENLPLKHSGSSGGLYSPDSFYTWRYGDPDGADLVRFDSKNVNECLMRVLQGNVKWMNRKHYAYIGTGDTPFFETLTEIQSENASAPDKTRLVCERAPGDHMTSLEPAIEKYHTVVMADLKRTGVSASASSSSVSPSAPPSMSALFASQPPPEEPPTPQPPTPQPPTSRPSQPSLTPQPPQAAQPLASQSPAAPQNSTPQKPNTRTQTVAFQRESGESLYQERRVNEDGQREYNRVEDSLGNPFGDEFSEAVSDRAYLVGFEISMKQRPGHDNPNIVSAQPLYRAKDGDKQGKGKLYGEKNNNVERAFAPKGYAVGALRGKVFGSVNGFELVFMKIRADGTLDPNDTQVSPWLGSINGSILNYSVIDGNGRPVTGVSGSIFMGQVHSLKLEFE